MGPALIFGSRCSSTLIVIGTTQEQVVFLSSTTGKEVAWFGAAGGVDAQGCLYTAHDTHLVMRKYCASSASRPTTPAGWQAYSSSLKLEWEISNILFQEVADAGRANSSRMYLYDRQMSVDWSADPTKPGFWSYDGKTTNPTKWPWDPRLIALDFTTWVRAIGTKTGSKHDFIFTTPAGQPLSIFKTGGPGTTTPPCAVFSNSGAKKQMSLEYFKVQGVNTHGCPVYSNVGTRSWSLPLPQFELPEDDANGGVSYDVSTDVMWVG